MDAGDRADVASVNAVARYLSDWPDATKRTPRIAMHVDGAEAAEECVETAADR